MEETKYFEEQSAPTIEHVSKKEVKQEKNKPEQIDEKLVNAILALDDIGLKYLSDYIFPTISFMSSMPWRLQ